MVKLLLSKQGRSANSQDGFGRTPLLLAAEKGHDRIAKLLRANSNTELDGEGQGTATRLSKILQNELKAVVQFLQGDDDRNLYFQDGYSQAALLWAAEYGHDVGGEVTACEEQRQPRT